MFGIWWESEERTKRTVIHEERREYEESSIGSIHGCGIGSGAEPAGRGFGSLGQLRRPDPLRYRPWPI
jgi:hypothetical protein